MNILLRQIGVIVTYLLLTLALIQMVGRIVLWNIDDLEERVNLWLEESGVVLAGLDGRWSLLNPVFFIDEMEIDGAKFQGMEIEIDTLESLARNRMVADHIHIEHVEVTIQRTDEGWDLPGSERREGSFDLWTTLRYSDYISVAFHLSLEDEQVVQNYVGTIESSNRANVNRVRLRIRDNDSCEDCWATFAHDEESFTTADGFRSSYAVVDLNDWSFPTSLLPFKPHVIARVSGSGTADFTHEHGQFVVALSATLDQGNELVQSFEIQSEAKSSVATLAGEVELTQESVNGDEKNSFPKIFYEYDWTDHTAHVWLDEIDVQALFELLASVLSSDEGLKKWFENLGAQGHLDQPQLLIESDNVTLTAVGKEMSIDAYRGVPSVKLEEVAISASPTSLLFEALPQSGRVAVVDYFEHGWDWDELEGRILIDFSNDHLGIRGYDLSASNENMGSTVELGLSRSTENNQYQFRIEGNAERISVSEIGKVLPNVLAAETRAWIEENILGGRAKNLFFSFHIYRGADEETYTSRLELTGLFEDASVNYYEGWPIVDRADGAITLIQDEVQITLTRSFVMDVPILDASVTIGGNEDGDFVNATFDVATDLSTLFEFHWDSELHAYLPFIEPSWSGTGPVSVSIDITLPLEDTATKDAHVLGSLTLDRGTLELSEYNISLSEIAGSVDFETPTYVQGISLQAIMFGKPANIEISSNLRETESLAETEPEIYVDVSGMVSPGNVFDLLELEPMHGFDGETPFSSHLTVYPDSDRPSSLDIKSDLNGIEIDLPRPFRKSESALRTTDVQLVFKPDWTEVSLQSAPFLAALQIVDSEITSGVVAFAEYPTFLKSNEPGITVTGTLEEFEFQAGGSSEFQYDETLKFDDFKIARLTLGNQQIPDVALSGVVGPELIEVEVSSELLNASIDWMPDQPYVIRATQLVVHSTDSDDDPLSLQLATELPRMNVFVDQLHYVDEHGDHDWGNWKFELHPAEKGIEIRELNANFGSFTLINDPTAVSIWNTEQNRTRFKGELRGGDLGEALTMWDYYDAVESEAFSFLADLSWNGSPLMFEFKLVDGGITGDVKEGRLIDVTQAEGAIKLTGLLNFTTLLERFQLDFDDVVDKGLSFDRILLASELNQGKFLMRDPLAIKGPGSEFRIGGELDANTETIDCEVIVTLPLSRSLPWYAATLASSNPLSAIGLLIGQRIFTAQLDRMSSGKYRVSGTFDEPEVEFVGLFLHEISSDHDQPTDNAVELNEVDVTTEEKSPSSDVERILE